ncbi:MAG: hypothetical protein GXP30_14130 [Verrucomicrobia bacterium]|nr:hypothetical protein [Verrucomicrobiota bacterium]
MNPLPPLRLYSLLLVLFLGIATSGHTQSKPKKTFRAGAATSNITPLMGVPLDGTIMQIGPAKDVHDELYARCLVLDDGTTRLAFAVVDNTMISREVYDQAKQLIHEKTGIHIHNICISATHTHSTPRAVVGLKPNSAEHKDYLNFLAIRISDGIRRAVNRLAPAKIAWGSFEEPRYVHNRRRFLKEQFLAANKNPFGIGGEIVSMNANANKADKEAGPTDPEVSVISVQHADGRPLAVFANYSLHYIGGIPGGTVSADYYGVFADRVQEQLQADRQSPAFVAIMSNGTSGDINANALGAPRKKYERYERMTQVGNDLAEGTVKLIKELEHRSDITLAAAATELELKIRKPNAKRIAWANKTKVAADHKGRLSRPQIYARETLFLKDYPDTIQVPLQAFRIGDLVVAQSPCETFAETGLAIKKNSSFPGRTFTIELANGYSGYLPSPQQFTWGGYETWPARSSYLEEQAEPKIKTALIDLLKQLHTKK